MVGAELRRRECWSCVGLKGLWGDSQREGGTAFGGGGLWGYSRVLSGGREVSFPLFQTGGWLCPAPPLTVLEDRAVCV